MDLTTPIRSAGRKYSFVSKKLEKLGIKKLEDFLYHIPHRYEDLSIISNIDSLQEGETVTIKCTIDETKNSYARRFQIQKVTASDATGTIECIWFNQPYVLRILKKGMFVSLSGRVERVGRKQTIQVKDYEIVTDQNSPTLHTGRLVPVYPETYGLTSKYLRNRMHELLHELSNSLQDFLPDRLRTKHNLLVLKKALHNIHFPTNLDQPKEARKRLAFDELFFTQLAAKQRRAVWEKKKDALPFKITEFNSRIKEFIEKLPFVLTEAQNRALNDIFSDVTSENPMNRLLQGDVGSGKTIVATVAMYLSYLNGFQSAFMAPTEILANQHFQTISKLLEPLGVKVGLITGNKKLSTLNFQFSILIGTHALLNEKVIFEKLGLVIIDEQQRFGVSQRAVLREKGVNPHFLTMTATPIPRTIFLTMYGDLDFSYLNVLPKGRQKIKTWLVPQIKRDNAYEWIKKQINFSHPELARPERGRRNSGSNKIPGLVRNDKIKNRNKNQVFIICPFIEESESMSSVKAAKKEFEYLKKNVFSDFSLGLLHGKIKNKEKNKLLEDFKNQKIDILVATPVVEVGIDIPNATIIVIEASERFGLAQLHQLRGRVGRSSKQSYCLLFTESTNPKTRERLKSLETNHIGADLAEIDLRLRGPGEMYGTAQHGATFFKIATFSDTTLIEATKKEAALIYPRISEFPNLMKKMEEFSVDSISPD